MILGEPKVHLKIVIALRLNTNQTAKYNIEKLSFMGFITKGQLLVLDWGFWILENGWAEENAS